MIHFLSPSWVKKADRFSKGVRKFIAYNRDLMPEAKLAEVVETRNAYDAALKARSRIELEGAQNEKGEIVEEGLEKKLLRLCEKAVPNYNASPIKENIEVIIVAVVVALGIRAYFLQPFKIPTASMQPTLNGIKATQTKDTPNVLTQAWQYGWNGRNYVNFVIPQEWGTVKLSGFRQYLKLNFFTFTELQFTDGKRTFTDFVYAPALQTFRDLCWNQSLNRLGINLTANDTPSGRLAMFGNNGMNRDYSPAGGPFEEEFRGGDVFARGFVESGDQLLVDKVSYHFRRPQRDEVFVFSTGGITGLMQEGKSVNEHYIKRLTGVPGDRLYVQVPNLFINGEPATGEGSRKVMSMQNDYKGYTLPSPQNPSGNFFQVVGAQQTAEVTMPEKSYMAMGDNSANSYDSRNWGPVPEENLVGPAFMVYWPFANHWGLIR